MSEMPSSERLGPQTYRPAEPQQDRGAVSQWPSSGWLWAGLAVVAVGCLAWSYLGPDLIRYMKIRDM